MKTISTMDLASLVAQELRAPEEQTRVVLDHAIDIIKNELQHGNSIELSRFISMRVKAGRPIATTTQTGGTLGLPASRTVCLELDEELRKVIEGAERYRILLVVSKKNFFTEMMAARLTSEHSEVVVVEGEQEALSQLSRSRPDLICLDVGLSDASKICETIKKNRASSLIAIIAIYNEGVEPNKVVNLQVMPDETILEPFELGDLVKLTEAELSRSAEERHFFEHEMHFRLQTIEDVVEQANDLIVSVLSSSGLSEEQAQTMSVAFREAIDNAARHGNKNDEELFIECQYIVDREKVTLTVQDEGEGFDTEIYLSRGVSGNPVDAARERAQAGGHGGLGIMLMLKCVDKIEYNYVGNKITLTKHIRKT